MADSEHTKLWCLEMEGREAASLSGVQSGATNRRSSDHIALLSDLVRNSGIHVPAITGHAPLDAAMRSSFAHTFLPNNPSFLVWIKGVNDSRLLASHEKFPPADACQQGRRTKIVIRTSVGWTVRTAARARIIEGVSWRRLLRPNDLARFQLECDNGVAGERCGRGIVVTGGDVQQASLCIDSGCGPYWRS
jgi:hypothetical protein